MSEGQEQNKSEEPTPFKLRKAREKGQVARGMDLGFVGSLLALGLVGLVAGHGFFVRLADMMRIALYEGIAGTKDTNGAIALTGDMGWAVFRPLVVFGGVLVVILVLLELIQLRGFFFTMEPLKPDFKRLNPATGLKRLFSMRMLKETLKSLAKFIVYTGAAYIVISGALTTFGPRLADGWRLANAMESAGVRLVVVFVAIAFAFMVIDQIIVRREFHKQMRMSRREVTRESKEREGEPRFKQKRRDIHAQMRSQTEALGQLPGSDLLVINPEHYAVALHYDPTTMDAPMVRARGRNHFAQLMKRKARLLAIPQMRDVTLARALYHETKDGEPIRPDHYYGVARLYRTLRETPPAPMNESE